MPTIDVYAATGTFPDRHRLAQDLAAAVMRGVVKKLTDTVATAVGAARAALSAAGEAVGQIPRNPRSLGTEGPND